MAEERDIKYINKEFSDFRSQLIDYTKNYFPDTYNDFSPTSPGMMFIEMASYVGDILSFYQDTQLQETYLTYAKDPKNLFNLAYMMGYTPKVTGASEAEIQVSQIIPATGIDNLPDWSQVIVIEENSTLRSTDSSQTSFILERPVDFSYSSSYDPTDVIINELDGSNNPTEYLLRKKVKAYSGEVKTKTFSIAEIEKFKTLLLSDSNIIKIQSIVDEDGNEWFEVPFLGQDTIYDDVENQLTDVNQVPYSLSLKKVPRRFITRFQANGDVSIQFGAGTLSSDDSTIIPDPSTVGNATNINPNRKLDHAYDPSNFLYSKSYGIAPTSELTVTYITGGGVSSNVPANTITQPLFTVPADVTFTNPQPASGGRDGDTVEELRENSLRSFNEQSRTVTLQDYAVRASSLPSKYGSIAKVYATQDQLTNSNISNTLVDSNALSLSLYVLALDNFGKLTQASPTLKENLKTYLSEYMIVTDSVNIKDAFIVNIGVEYEVIIRPNFAGRDVLLNCNLKIQEYFKTNKRSINQPINLSDLYRDLDKVKGVQTVQNVLIVNRQGGDYSQYAYDIKGATRTNVIYPSYDPCIFEIKHPEKDIKGRTTTL